MFCFQCEQTFAGSGCTRGGVCGKKPEVALLQDRLTGAAIDLARDCAGRTPDPVTHRLVLGALFATVTNVSFCAEELEKQIEELQAAGIKIRGAKQDTGEVAPYDLTELWTAPEDIRSLKSLLLFGLRGMAAYAWHAASQGIRDPQVDDFFYRGLAAIAANCEGAELLDLILELGKVNLRCMELLDEANTGSYGHPVPTTVSLEIAPGPFIVISGHDLHDLQLLLEQTTDIGVDIYTHGEMLPAHAYPELSKYPHLKGNFGTAWQNQQREFANLPGAILFTTNCLMPVQASYRDRVFTTAVVSYPDLVHIDEAKDFSPVIARAIELGGYSEKQVLTGINGGTAVQTGFAHHAVLAQAEKIIAAIKAGELRHIFLVGGCDGARGERSYYTEFVRQTPPDSIVLTLACGKYRFNDLDLGEIAGLPRLLDMGQCNDAYSAIKVASALAEAFGCGVNDLPLTLVLSWYEQKAVCILLTLLALGIRKIHIGPSLPAFISANVLKTLVETFELTPITTPGEDLAKIFQ
ncbi:MAG: hydroxylamine reductase [Symbiobacteriaceae bacterium]|nr:hydroxylamine reductase [Symbiobacteriaceae bacterium]